MRSIRNWITLGIVLIMISDTIAQPTKKVTIKHEFPSTREVYSVLKSDKSVKHGAYTKTLGGKKLVQGNFSNDQRTGEWKYFDANEQIAQVVNYDDFTLTSNIDPKNSSPGSVLLGGYPQFYRIVAHTMKYPAEARRRGTQGQVHVKFTVNENGTASNFQVVQGIGDGCDEEAVRAVKTSGIEWFPAVDENGEPIKNEVTIPIIFKLFDR